MKDLYKILILCGVIIFAVTLGPHVFTITLFIVFGSYASFIDYIVSDQEFESEFSQIPEVARFITQYPNYTTSHWGDFLGWKIVSYYSDEMLQINVEKSLIHGGVKIYGGCDYGGSSYVMDIPQEEIIDYIDNDRCMR